MDCANECPYSYRNINMGVCVRIRDRSIRSHVNVQGILTCTQ